MLTETKSSLTSTPFGSKNAHCGSTKFICIIPYDIHSKTIQPPRLWQHSKTILSTITTERRKTSEKSKSSKRECCYQSTNKAPAAIAKPFNPLKTTFSAAPVYSNGAAVLVDVTLLATTPVAVPVVRRDVV